jgi:hypothetical protein
MLQNGDFAQGSNSWFFAVNGNANAAWTIENGISQFYITNGGTSLSSIELLRWGQALIQGEQYVLQFDGWADQSRYIQVQLVQNGGQFIDYGALNPTLLTPNSAHFRYVFNMVQSSDFSVNLLFDLGSVAGTVNLANISLFRSPLGDLNLDGRVDVLDLGTLCGNWLKKQNNLPDDLDGDGKVDFNDFVPFGQNWGLGAR